jgi:phage gp16-like protein
MGSSWIPEALAASAGVRNTGTYHPAQQTMSHTHTTTPPRATGQPGATSGARRRAGMPNARRADLAQIHQLAKEIGLDDDAYRDLMATVCGGVRSAALLDVSGRQRFIAHLRRCLGRPEQRLTRPAAQGREIARPLLPREKLMWALWMQLAEAGAVEHRTMQALSAYVERQTGVARVEWLNVPQQIAVVESLKKWLERLQLEARS